MIARQSLSEKATCFRMLVKVISMSFDSALGGFNDMELREFLKDKEFERSLRLA